jgi:hypothetical protein
VSAIVQSMYTRSVPYSVRFVQFETRQLQAQEMSQARDTAPRKERPRGRRLRRNDRYGFMATG